MMKQKFLLQAKCFVIALSLLSTAHGQQDVTRPGDPIIASSANSPAAEGVANIIDNKADTKYLNFDNAKGDKASGFVVTPSAGVSVVTGMTLQSANDAPERDPWSVLLEGSNDAAVTDFVSGNWVEIFFKEEIPAFATRGQTQSFSFENATAYKHYRWTVYDTQELNDCCMQVAEVELLGTIPGGGEPPVDVTPKPVVTDQPLQITKNLQPQNQPISVRDGDSLILELQVQGGVAPVRFEWKYTKGGSDAWSTVAGQTAAALVFASVTSANAGFYYADVRDAAGGVVQSEISKIEVEPKSTGTIIADLGFRPRTDGFSFENYGNTIPSGKVVNLTPVEVRRMFGDRVVSRVDGNQIILTPPARKWMEKISTSMDGGHCAGLSYMSLLAYPKHLNISSTFGVNSVPAFTLEKNVPLQREIGYWWATQVVSPGGDRIQGTPVEILDRLIAALKPDATDTYSIAIFKRDWKGGHAVTPYAVEDIGNGIYHVLLYDNNWPNRTRRMIIDRQKNTWQYSASINPQAQEDLYEGDATTGTLMVEPMSRHNQLQICGFCDDPSEAANRRSLSGSEGPLQHNEIFVDGNGVQLLITHNQGRRYGWDGGVFFREIPDVSHRLILGADLWNDDRSPVFLVPEEAQYELSLRLPESLDVSSETNRTYTAVTMIGDGFEIAVEDIWLEPGEVDTLVFTPDGSGVSYTSSASESPDLTLGFEAPDADFEFTVAGAETDPGATIHLKLDRTKGTLTLSSSGNTEVGYYDLAVVRYDDDSEQYFYHDEIELEPKDLAILDYGTWQGEADTLDLQIDWDGDGTIDEFLELTDEETPDFVDASGPRLRATQIGGGKVEISWSDEDLWFTLEANTDLGTAGWFPITEDRIVTQDGVRKVIIETNQGSGSYFRLSDDY